MITNEFVESYTPLLFSVAKKLTRDKTWQHDLVQAAWEKLLGVNFNRVEDVTPQWVTVVAYRAMLTEAEKEVPGLVDNLTDDELQELMDDQQGVQESPLDELLLDEDITNLIDNWDGLPEEDAEIAAARFFEDMKIKDIGERFGLTYKQARTRIDNIKKTLIGEYIYDK